jgi:hypothetical protein
LVEWKTAIERGYTAKLILLGLLVENRKAYVEGYRHPVDHPTVGAGVMPVTAGKSSGAVDHGAESRGAGGATGANGEEAGQDVWAFVRSQTWRRALEASVEGWDSAAGEVLLSVMDVLAGPVDG